VIYAGFSCLDHCNSFSRYRARLADTKGNQKIDDLPVLRLASLVLQRCSLAKLTVLLAMEALGNVWYGSRRPLTNLTQTFQACHLCTFNMAAIFVQGHPYIWRTTIRHHSHRMPALPRKLMAQHFSWWNLASIMYKLVWVQNGQKNKQTVTRITLPANTISCKIREELWHRDVCMVCHMFFS